LGTWSAAKTSGFSEMYLTANSIVLAVSHDQQTSLQGRDNGFVPAILPLWCLADSCVACAPCSQHIGLRHSQALACWPLLIQVSPQSLLLPAKKIHTHTHTHTHTRFRYIYIMMIIKSSSTAAEWIDAPEQFFMCECMHHVCRSVYHLPARPARIWFQEAW
jgi:hypothetical protein